MQPSSQPTGTAQATAWVCAQPPTQQLTNLLPGEGVLLGPASSTHQDKAAQTQASGLGCRTPHRSYTGAVWCGASHAELCFLP